jgi:hypothetical protein
MAVPFPGQEPAQRPDAGTRETPAADPPDGSDGEAPTEAPPSEPREPAPQPARSVSWPSSLGSAGDDVASVLLGLLLWGWVIRPYLAGGTQGIKNMLRAKFINQDAKGGQLP